MLPLLLLAALCCLQALLLACALVFAQVAVDRAASGATQSQSLASIPSGWRERGQLERSGSRVSVRVSAPTVVPGAGRWLDVTASTEVRA